MNTHLKRNNSCSTDTFKSCMEFSKSICVNLQKIYPNDTFVAYLYTSSSYGNINVVCTANELDKPNIIRLILSAAASVNNSALESLLHKVVFDSRGITDTYKRAIHIQDHIKKMLPGTNATVIVQNSNINEKPEIFGPNKGVAYYWEAEFGSHVSVIIH